MKFGKIKDFFACNIKRGIGLLLCILNFAFFASFLTSLSSVDWAKDKQYLFLVGFGVYIFLHFVLGQPKFLYVLAHEISHSIASFLFGGSLHSITVSENGGNVKTTKMNFFTLLFPYWFPFFAVLIMIVYVIESLVGNIASWRPALLFLIGLALSHHLCLTAYSLTQDQSDVKANGFLFSISFIIAGNMLVLMSFASVILQGPSFQDFFATGVEYIKGFIW